MAFARTTHSDSIGFAADCVFSQLSGWAYPLVPAASGVVLGVSGPGGVASYDVYMSGSGGGVDPPPAPAWMEQSIRATIAGMPPVTGEEVVGRWDRETAWPYNWAYMGDETHTVICTGNMGPLHLYKMRDDEPMPEYENGPSEPCHPLHLGMKYAWGAADYSTVIDAELCAKTVTGLSMTLLREVDDDPLIFNATSSDSEGVSAEGPELHFITNEATLGRLDDEAEWELG